MRNHDDIQVWRRQITYLNALKEWINRVWWILIDQIVCDIQR